MRTLPRSNRIPRPLIVLALLAVRCAIAAAAEHEPYQEPFRPQFHFTAARNWLNDPNGLVCYKGEYHLFFQHNPAGIDWGNMTWGHAVSPDLVHWRQLDHAIRPDRLGTIFSGSAVVDRDNTANLQHGDEKTLVAVYTAAGGTSPESKGQPFTQCIAWSNDRGRTWTKYDKNPVLGHIVKENRDPKVVWHAPGRRWIMALYKDGETYALFASPDLKNWTHLHDLTMPGCGECPDFFEMPVQGDAKATRWVFTAANGNYRVGTFDGKRFMPETPPLVADYGANYYAVQTYSDAPDGRRIQIAWMRGGKYPAMPFNQQMSFPCDLTLRALPEGLRICRLPVREIETLRHRRHTWTDTMLSPGANLLADVRGDLFDIIVEIEPGDATEIALVVRGEPIRYATAAKRPRPTERAAQASAGEPIGDATAAKRPHPTERAAQASAHEPIGDATAAKRLTCLGKSADLAPIDGRIRLRVLVDRTSLEVFANDGRVVMTSCFLPRPENKSLALHATGGPAKIVSLDVYELRSAWPSPPPPGSQAGPRR